MVKTSLVVLVVDDIEPMRKVTAAQLNSLGVQDVRTAADGVEALKMLRESVPDIVLSDWNMPAMNGIELLRAMRADNRLEHLPFVMITAESERVRIEEAIAHGVCDLLVKPYTTGRLSLSIERAMSRRSPRLQRGVINAASRPPPSTTNQPVLPAGAGEAGKVAAAQSAAKLTILVVDDKPDNLHLLVNVFKDDYRILATD
ncbi:MAG: response regulator, partial [Pseudomonadota bacterium]